MLQTIVEAVCQVMIMDHEGCAINTGSDKTCCCSQITEIKEKHRKKTQELKIN